MKNETSYAALIRKGMRDRNMTRRDLENALKAHESKGGHAYSYEHIRKVASGLPLMSEKFNEDVCFVLGLNPEATWEVALREKMKKQYGRLGHALLPTDQRLRTAWTMLNEGERERAIKFCEGMAAAHVTSEQESDDPAVIQARITRDMQRLTVALRQPQQKTVNRR